MNQYDIVKSQMRTVGDLAGVFEFDGVTGYFYLYEVTGTPTQKIRDSIKILSTILDFDQTDVKIRWDSTESKVGLLILSKLWAVFDVDSGHKHGGNYLAGATPQIPVCIAKCFN